MTGTEKRRHCASCDKHVVALAEMTPDEAEALVRASKPHSLCLRIEHDEAGTILFRKKAPLAISNRAMPLLTLAVGASLFAVACEPSPAPSATRDNAKTDSTEGAAPTASVNKDSTPPIDPFNAKTVPHAEAQSASDMEAISDGGTDARPVKIHNAAKTRITTGCVCAPGDSLCSCL